MSIDLSKLTPAPWTIEIFAAADTEDGNAITAITCYADENGKEGATLAEVNRWTFGDDPATEESDANAAFLVIARNAFDVMMRRGWGVHKEGDFWFINGTMTISQIASGCPFTALVEADKWYRENVEANL